MLIKLLNSMAHIILHVLSWDSKHLLSIIYIFLQSSTVLLLTSNIHTLQKLSGLVSLSCLRASSSVLLSMLLLLHTPDPAAELTVLSSSVMELSRLMLLWSPLQTQWLLHVAIFDNFACKQKLTLILRIFSIPDKSAC